MNTKSGFKLIFVALCFISGLLVVFVGRQNENVYAIESRKCKSVNSVEPNQEYKTKGDKSQGNIILDPGAGNVIVSAGNVGIGTTTPTAKLDVAGDIKTTHYTVRKVNLTEATTDYMLAVGEEAIIHFTNATTVPLRIATTDGTLYELELMPANTGGTSGGVNNPIFLRPNNTSYTGQFVWAGMWRNSGAFGHAYTTHNEFRIGQAFSSIRVIITNRTVYKNIKGFNDVYGIGTSFPTIISFSTCWRNTETPWTSLGTIVFPQASSGTILIKRLI